MRPTIHSQEFHELAMNYRSARADIAQQAYEQLLAHIDSRIEGNLYDYFAGKAMQGMLMTPNPKLDKYQATKDYAADLAELSYLLANFMLAERAK